MLSASFQASAIEEPDPVHTSTVSAYLGMSPGVGVNVAADYVIVNNWWKGHFTVGGYAGFFNSKDTESVSVSGVTIQNKNRDFNFAVMPRATYGLNINDSFEVHAGTMMGLLFDYTKTRGSVSSSVADVSGNEKKSEVDLNVAYAEIIGCRYYLTDNFGVSAELGVGNVSYLNLGFSYRF